MKNSCSLLLALIVSVSALNLASALEERDNLFSRPVESEWQATHRTNMLTRWEAVTFQTNLVTRKVSIRTNTFTEIGAGLNLRDSFGNFIAADPSFEITPTGAEARGTMHTVSVPADIYSGDGIVIVQPGGSLPVFRKAD